MLCNNSNLAQRALNATSRSNLVVLDTETSGLNRFGDYVVGWVLTTGPSPDETFYIPVRHQGGGNLPGCSVPNGTGTWDGTIHPIEMELTKLFASNPSRLVVGHNLQFDMWYSRKHGVKFPCRLSDTMLTQGLINEYSASFSLSACCKAMHVQEKKGEPLYEYLAAKFGGEPNQRQMANFWKTDASDEIVWDYASGDGTSTWQLHHRQMEDIKDDVLDKDTLEQVYDVECRVIPVIHDMIWRGIKVDVDRLNEVHDIVNARIDEAKSKFPASLNLRSGKQMAEFFTANGVTDFPTTEKGNPSFTESWLLQSELGRHVVAVRKYETLRSSFILPMKERHLHNGRVHPWYNQGRDDVHGTVTGRFSSSDPNIQQISKRDKVIGRLFRSIFVPDDGKVWASVDFSQCEPRLLAHLLCFKNQNNALAEGYRQSPSVDAHSAVATAAGIDRDSAKRLNQGMITGAGKGKVTSEMQTKGKTASEAERVFNAYFLALPELKPMQKNMAKTMSLRGYIKTLLKRRCHLNDPRFDYKALNRYLQGGNADIIKLKMVEISDYLATANSSVVMLSNIHDAIDFEFYEEDRHHYEHCLKIMTDFGPESVIPLRVPMEVDAGEGPDWAIATYGEE